MTLKKKKVISPEDLVRFLAFTKANLGEYWYTLFLTHAVLGTRIQELLLLIKEDFNFEKKEVTIPSLKRDKKNKDSQKRVSKEGKEFIVYPITLPFSNEDMFRNMEIVVSFQPLYNNKKPLFSESKKTVQRWFNYVSRSLGLNCSSHSFRHLQGTMTYSITKDVYLTAIRLRHKKPSTAFEYIHLLEESNRDISDKVNEKLFKREKKNES